MVRWPSVMHALVEIPVLQGFGPDGALGPFQLYNSNRSNFCQWKFAPPASALCLHQLTLIHRAFSVTVVLSCPDAIALQLVQTHIAFLLLFYGRRFVPNDI